MPYQTVLFYLDGTLTDPGLGITNSILYALKKMGYPTPPRQSLYRFIGPPLLESFALLCGADKAVEATHCYREYFAVEGKFENQVYEGVPALLQKLKAQGLRLAVATSKPEEFSIEIVEHFGLAPYFDFVAGSAMDGSRSKKGEVIAYALERGKIDPAATVMVGDREHDVIGAKENGLPCFGVLYGYGNEDELLHAGAMGLAKAPADLFSLLIGG